MIDQEVERKVTSILKILANQTEPLGARMISRQLSDYGIALTERAVRYHLQLLDERGLTTNCGKDGRSITVTGLEEIRDSLVSDKIGLVIGKIDTLSFRTTFDPETLAGKVILNTTFFPVASLPQAMTAMKEVFAARLCVSDLVAFAREGETLGEMMVPKGKVGFGTVCSITINGIFLKAGIPVDSKFGGILQIKRMHPSRFTDLISYAGSTLDPLEVFIRSKMTNVTDAAKRGEGKILASFREIPVICLPAAEATLAKLQEVGINGLITLGRPSQPVLEVPVTANRIGIVVIGGLNPLAAVEEAGIVTDNKAMSSMVDFRQLRSFWELYDQIAPPAS